ncbi:MAG TPA: NAD(P)H-hydrate dehydratase [Caldisericia bacterium]|nr:NAD(P)H-hydrate dehydratase [Caldisericia bacterium]
MILHDSQSSKQCDIDLLNELGVDTLQLMELAAKVTADLIQADFTNENQPEIAVFCGPGNNGGDGLATARLLFCNDWKVFCYILRDPSLYHGAAKHNFLSLQTISQKYPEKMVLRELPSIDDILLDFQQNHICLILDAIFGVGLNSLIHDYFLEIINLINTLSVPVYSIDMPSGIHTDTACVMNVAIKAFKTITFSVPKIAHCLYPGKEHTGRLVVRSIGIQTLLLQKYQKALSFFSAKESSILLPLRLQDSHKGSYGSVFIFGGSVNYPGALSLAASSALTSGAGKVFAIYPSNLNSQSSLPVECIHMPINLQTATSNSVYDDLCSHLNNTSSILCIGPGLGRNESSLDLVKQFYLKWKGKIVIDADGLYAIKDLIHQFSHPSELILTPHLGEMSFLTGLSLEKIKCNLLSTAQYYADLWNCTLVLKSASTVVASKDQTPFIQYFGNPGMATAGSGDVLAGVISALMCQSLGSHNAAILGTTLHSLAGDIASKSKTMWSSLASDIISSIPSAFSVISD